MLTRILRWLKGCVRIRIRGYSPERFLNLCRYHHIPVWGLTPKRNAYEMYITVQSVRRLKPILKKTGTKMEILKKQGLPFFVFRHRKRKFFCVGGIGCILLVYIFSLFIWDIDISGNHVRTDETVLSFLRKNGVSCGMRRSDVDCQDLVKMIRKEFDDIIWVSASLTGSRIEIHIKENSDSKEIKEKKKTKDGTDLIAEKDGVIKKIVTRSGIPKVHEGDRVKKGDVLVSGRVDIQNDNKETVAYQYQDSDADILIQSEEIYEDTLPLEYSVKEYDKHIKRRFYIKTEKKEYVFGGNLKQGENTELHSDETRLGFSDSFLLPVSVGIKEQKTYQNRKKIYTQKQYQAILSQHFERFCKDLRKKGVQILKNDVKIYKDKNNAQAKGKLILLEKCGKERKTEHVNLRENRGNTG